MLSSLPLASVIPSGLKATLLTGAVCPVRIAHCSPVAAFQRRIVLSALPLASVRPSGLKATLQTTDVCPASVLNCCLVVISHKRTVLSRLPLASVRPSGLNATLKTQFVCSLRVFSFSPVLISHKRMVLPLFPLANVFSVATEHDTEDILRILCKGFHLSTRCHIPQVKIPIFTSTCEYFAINAESHSVDPV